MGAFARSEDPTRLLRNHPPRCAKRDEGSKCVMRIRDYQTSDAAALADIFNRKVREIASRHYSTEQIAAWLGGGMEAGETHVRCSDGRAVWVAVNESDTAIAFIDLEDDGHIDMLFCQPEWVGTRHRLGALCPA